jgi:hypothetical protein
VETGEEAVTHPTLPFGRHKDKPLSEVPADYLKWLLREYKLSSGMRSTVAAELAGRGVEVPPPPPRPEPCCADHPAAGYRALWGEDSLGRKFIRSECRQCRQAMGHLPMREPYIGMADANASPAPVLDALVGAEAAGVEIRSDGRTAWLSDYRKAPPGVRNALRQAKHTLAGMIGDDRQEAAR